MDVRADLIRLSDEVWERTNARLEGLTDDEYFWEPAPGCWTIRQRDDGVWAADWPIPRPDPEPFTTIAWRLWHLIDMYGEDRAPRWLDLPPQGDAVGFDAPEAIDREPPSSAADALDRLDRAHARWRAHLVMVDDERLEVLIGPVAGEYADRPRTSYVLHMLDEFIHHGAEIATIRDLWRWQRSVDDDPVIEKVMRGDASVVDDTSADARSGLVDRAVAFGRMGLARKLVERGDRFESPTLIHTAALAGDLDLVKALVAAGADPTVTDDEYRATAIEWADFGRRDDVAEWLRGRDESDR